ncbi:Rec8 like protein-domain-containing protein [Schizophyllum amplum]|uniref:Rec8 like protein-domain-containing protein n=1 Tax=Schizophyllum amplum TaxID=97359 RepID=A0A550CXM8_9AGAR|nr:Rec8 like protein-domain-containing protein [Auriculariopsis ampla]
MFYSEAILSRRGPLGKVWLAAHMERKLSKTQTLQTDIGESVDAIMGQEIEVMALRLSGQLLLGVVRIYSRKAKYLLDDCNEALLKIKMAFRPGVVDMTEGELTVNKNAITLQGNGIDLDAILPDFNWDEDFEVQPLVASGQHQARIDDITLRTDNLMDFSDPMNLDIGPSDGIGSQDFDVDLGIDWGDEFGGEQGRNEEDSMSMDGSVGVGRRDSMAPSRLSMDSRFAGGRDGDLLSQRSRSRDPSEHPFGGDMMDVDMDMPDLGTVDLGDLGVGFDDQPMLPIDDQEKTPGQTRGSSRASSPLSDIPPTPPAQDDLPAEDPTTPVAKKQARKPREKKQIIDSVTELEGGPGAKTGRGRNAGFGAQNDVDVSDILTEQHFLPRSTLMMRLLEVHDDPLAHFMPTKVTPDGTFLSAAPPGLPAALADMFLMPVTGAKRGRGAEGGRPLSKRARTAAEEEEVEQGRREASAAPSFGLPDGGDVPFDFGDQSLPLDDFQLELPELPAADDAALPHASQRGSMAPSEHSRFSTPAFQFEEEGETFADASCPIAAFDGRTQSQEQREDDGRDKAYSRNTGKALTVIRRELRPTEGEADADADVLSFNRMAQKASRRAAAAFFFELLVLATRDCVRVTQEAPFENIEVWAKEKLWERQTEQEERRERRGSAAPSESELTGMESRMGSAAPSRRGSAVPSRMGSATPSRRGSVAPSRVGSAVPTSRASAARSIGAALGL